ncbi:hypothetical protein GCM10010346_51320 [Streptomyces chryseus]|uniref:Uncharacterized protein n=1 Tax=Streptomyces chryseus TaxID=68186 RepID=A0ABQ3E0S8_9ACTN|nr:hypothetical protein GCM10010346_51320 [Streptomyces chryseus]
MIVRGAVPSGAVCAGSNPAGGTSQEAPKDPAISENAENGVFAYAQSVLCALHGDHHPALGHSSGGSGGCRGGCRSVLLAFSARRVVSHGHRSGKGRAEHAKWWGMRHRWDGSGGHTP